MDDAARANKTDAHIYVTAPDGKTTGYVVPATASRPDVASAFPGAGEAHGFSRSIAITKPGSYRVCVYAKGAPVFADASTTLECRTVDFGPTAPTGSVDDLSIRVTDASAALTLRGWALDNGLRSAPTEVHVYVTDPSGSTVGHVIDATVAGRTDVAAAFPGAGPNHGFSHSIPITRQGVYKVCAYGISAEIFSGNANLACRSVNFGPGAPIGSFDQLTAQGTRTLTASGWTLDNAARSADTSVKLVLISPDGTSREIVASTSTERADVGRAFPGAGSQHGFSVSAPISGPGNYRVCVLGSTAKVFGSTYAALSCQNLIVGG